MAAWLGRQRKPELLALAVHTTLEELEGLRKDELVSVLDEHLQQNSTKYTGNAAFTEYYGKSSPTKRASGANLTSDGEAKPKKPRAPKVKKETADAPTTEAGPSSAPAVAGPSSASHTTALTPAPPRSQAVERAKATIRTPLAALHNNRLTTFPPSPAVVTDAIDAQTRRWTASLDKALGKARLRTLLHDIREVTSSVVGIETIILLHEGFHLHREVAPPRHLFDLPANKYFNSEPYPVEIPDALVLITDVYWKVTTLWLLVSLFVPLLVSWFFNLTIRPVQRAGQTVHKPRWRCDPLSFNVAKALVAWLVFGRGARFFGTYSDFIVNAVAYAMPGNYPGLLVGAGIGGLASLYDATQRK